MAQNETKPTTIQGRVRVIDQSDVDTDMIFHNRHLHITDPAEMRGHIFGNLPGWENYPQESRPGDILIVGHNFGCGSSRQQAVDGLVSLGVTAVVGRSFGAIYKRNAINAGWPLIECLTILESGIEDGDEITIDLESGTISSEDNQMKAQGKPMSSVQWDIYRAGGLLELAAFDK